MSDFSLTLVLQIKTSKIINNMAKVQQKFEKISAFGGIFVVLDKFDSILSSVIDSHLGLRSTLIGWLCVARLNYTLTDDSYCAEYSRYNHETHRFEQPQERMVYALYLDDAVNYITYYHRDDTSSPFRLVSQLVVNDQPLLYAMK